MSHTVLCQCIKMTKQTLLKKLQTEFEMNPTRVGRELILKQMVDKGLKDEAEELEMSVCDSCLGTGEVEDLEFNSDAKTWLVSGTKRCFCRSDDEK